MPRYYGSLQEHNIPTCHCRPQRKRCPKASKSKLVYVEPAFESLLRTGFCKRKTACQPDCKWKFVTKRFLIWFPTKSGDLRIRSNPRPLQRRLPSPSFFLLPKGGWPGSASCPWPLPPARRHPQAQPVTSLPQPSPSVGCPPLFKLLVRLPSFRTRGSAFESSFQRKHSGKVPRNEMRLLAPEEMCGLEFLCAQRPKQFYSVPDGSKQMPKEPNRLLRIDFSGVCAR